MLSRHELRPPIERAARREALELDVVFGTWHVSTAVAVLPAIPALEQVVPVRRHVYCCPSFRLVELCADVGWSLCAKIVSNFRCSLRFEMLCVFSSESSRALLLVLTPVTRLGIASLCLVPISRSRGYTKPRDFFGCCLSS